MDSDVYSCEPTKLVPSTRRRAHFCAPRHAAPPSINENCNFSIARIFFKVISWIISHRDTSSWRGMTLRLERKKCHIVTFIYSRSRWQRFLSPRSTIEITVQKSASSPQARAEILRAILFKGMPAPQPSRAVAGPASSNCAWHGG